jgi:hypothetical protein
MLASFDTFVKPTFEELYLQKQHQYWQDKMTDWMRNVIYSHNCRQAPCEVVHPQPQTEGYSIQLTNESEEYREYRIFFNENQIGFAFDMPAWVDEPFEI